MLRVAEQYTGTDTGRQRRANEDALLARAPLYVVADGMGGAQAGEVASRIAVEVFQPGLREAADPEQALAALVRVANTRIHELSHSNAEQAGMGTTLTAIYVGEHDVAIAHVGDSRAYRLRDGELLRLTDDHTLVDELLRQGRLTPEEAVEHPQRSVITRALGPEGAVDVDTRTFPARDGDVYLLCSDGLTTMVSEQDILRELLAHARLHDAGEALIRDANDAGGRDNVTVVLVRLEELSATLPAAAEGDAQHDQQTVIGLPAVHPAHQQDATPPAAAGGARAGANQGADGPAAGDAPRALDARGDAGGLAASLDADAPAAGADAPAAAADAPVHGADAGAGVLTGAATSTRPASTAEVWNRATAVRRIPRPGPARTGAASRRSPLRHLKAIVVTLIVLGLVCSGAYLALQNVYFIGTNDRGLVTLFQGVPYQLPGGLDLYSRQYVSGVSASRVAAARRRTLLDHSLHTESDAASIIHSLELEQLE